MRRAYIWSIVAVAIIGATAALSPGAGESAEAPISAITRPSGDVPLSFVRPGLIMEMNVKKGDPVKKDQIVAKQDDREEVAMLAAAKDEAESETEINAEKAVREFDQADYELKRKSGSLSEAHDAELKVIVDKARIDLAVDKKKQAQFKYQSSLAGIEKLKLISPIDGAVQELYMEKGAATNGQDMKVMRVVQVDPLWVEVPVPIQKARALKIGDPAQVLFQDGKVRMGKVDVKESVADAAAGTLNVRLVVPNPEKLEAGETVKVTFGTSSVASTPPVSQ